MANAFHFEKLFEPTVSGVSRMAEQIHSSSQIAQLNKRNFGSVSDVAGLVGLSTLPPFNQNCALMI
jgi:hypothetical protein